jgi:uncharacterized protein (DUF2147 family)
MHNLASLRRWPSRLQQVGYITMFLVCMAFPTSHAATISAIPEGVWLIDEKVAVQIFDCSGLLCGRILWLQIPRDSHGDLNLDKNNPNPALQHRGLCGLSIFWGLRSIGPDRWAGGRFYNPDDGKTYNISAEVRSADILVARIYAGIRILGKTKILHRVPHGTSNGWC